MARPVDGTARYAQRAIRAVTTTTDANAGGAAIKTPLHTGQGLELPAGGITTGSVGPIERIWMRIDTP
jgi:hypothetical protein